VNVAERRRLLEALETLAYREAENNPKPVTETFLPLKVHRLALRPEIVLVRGGRGAGKSALFRLLASGRSTGFLRRFFGDERLPDARWVDAFSQSKRHPSETALDEWATEASKDDLRIFWLAHLVLRLNEEGIGAMQPPAQLLAAWQERRSDPRFFMPFARPAVGELTAALDGLDALLGRDERLVFATYDHLDRLGQFQPVLRERYVAALLALWLSFANRYQHLRAKVFLRDDILDAGEASFADASKLRARSVSIEWDVESLYRVGVRHMAAAGEGLRDWVRKVGGGLELQDDAEFGWMPGDMAERTQRAFAERLAGEVMGTGSNKGYTYRWIPNRIQDAQRRIVPRSMLSILGFAARSAVLRPLGKGNRLIRPSDLYAALEGTSKERVREISEEYPAVRRLENLRGLHVMLEKKQVVERVARPVEEASGGIPTNGEAVFDELLRLGVVKVRTDGRVDVPDIYRSGFGIKRRGGVGRPT